MPDYRLYFLDETGHIRHAIELDCETDADAIALVDRHRDGRAMELWHLARQVRTFNARRDGPGRRTPPT